MVYSQILLWGIILLYLGALFFARGLKVIITKRPLVISIDKYVFPLMCLIAFPLLFLLPSNHVPNLAIMSIVIAAMILAIILSRTKNYSIYGLANPSAYRESLIAVLNTLNIPFQEDITGISVPSENIKLHSDFSPNGTVTLRVDDILHATWLKQLADALNRYYESNPVNMEFKSSVRVCLCGVCMVTISLMVFMSHYIK